MEATAAPVALRPCGTCGADAEFASTGLFRVNAQKKRLDVWLIYRCATCGSVWNSAVISRGRPGSIDREELERFTGNDPVMALWCALDVGLLRRNGARRGKVAFVVEGDRPAAPGPLPPHRARHRGRPAPFPMFHVKHSFYAHRWGATVGVCYHDGEHSGHAKEPSCTD